MQTSWDSLEADFTRFYQTDLREACWGADRWGVRRLWSHISGLPRESAFKCELSGPFAYWDEPVRVLADVYDAIQYNTDVLLRINGNNPDDLVPYPRPNGGPVEAPELSMAELFERTKGFNT